MNDEETKSRTERRVALRRSSWVSLFLRRVAFTGMAHRRNRAPEGFAASICCSYAAPLALAIWKNYIRLSHVARERSQSEGEALTAMDYTLPAVKMHIAQLKPAKPAKESRPTGGAAFTIGSLVFQRAWLQGVLVPGVQKASLALQDGTGVLPIELGAGESGTVGTYVLLVGMYLLGDDGSPYLFVQKKVDLSSSERDEFWQLEVAEAHKLFYNKLINAPTP